jgi:hypothetical protein
MARDDQPTPFRRFMMQAIMWVILGATVAAAALVNRVKEAALHPSLGERVELDGVSVGLPSGWKNLDHEAETGEIIRVDPNSGILLQVAVHQVGFQELYGMTQRTPGARARYLDEIDLGGAPARLMLDQFNIGRGESLPALIATRRLPQLREIAITVISPNVDERSRFYHEIDLIKRVAASVKVVPSSP